MHCVYIVKKLKKQPLPTRIICKQDLISNGQDRGGACGVVNAVSATLRGDDGRRNVESSRRSCGFYSAHDTSAESTCSLSLMQTYGAVLLSSAGLGFIMERALTAAARDVPKRSGGAVNMITTRLLFLFILPSLSLCAPQAQKTLSDDTPAPDLANPFGSSEENRRLLQNYIKSSLKEGQTNPELNTREQEVFFLFSLYDYDRSGQMDGLELMQLLTDFLTYHEIMPKSTDSIVSLVDYLLQAQDLNQDGLLAPSELLSSSTIDHQQENNIVPPDPPADEALNQERTHTTSEDGDPETHQQDAEVNLESEHENEMPEKFEEQHDQLQDDHQQQKNMPVHQEQPEM